MSTLLLLRAVALLDLFLFSMGGAI